MSRGELLFAGGSDRSVQSDRGSQADLAGLAAVTGVVFSIQRYSVHDGPGLRTNVFLKGCPLRCGWCANPESQQRRPELALAAGRCIDCGQFGESCPVCWARQAENGERATLELELGGRPALCPVGAIYWAGETTTAGAVLARVRRDVPFYDAGGGMTLTGGEPTQQPDFAAALLRLARGEGIATAMETCGHARWEVWERLLPHLDEVLFDVKHVDAERHRAETGLDNLLILDNLRRLAAGSARVTVRVPLVPGFNADRESMAGLAEFLVTLPRMLPVDLLPYHTLGKAKYRALGREYPWDGHARLTDDEVEELAAVLTGRGLAVRIGG
jgi:pyruvate formate lyase activating enzyme